MADGADRTWDVVTDGLHFPEGPVAMPDGSVVVVEIQSGDLTRVLPNGTKETVAHCGGGPNGAAVGPDGAFYVCNNGGFAWAEMFGLKVPVGRAPDHRGGSIQRVDPATGEVTVLYSECEGIPLRAPNDIVFDSAGGFWFTDLGHTHDRMRDQGAVYYGLADGSRIIEAVFPVDSPNGIGLSPAQDRLYVADSLPARVWVWSLDGPGNVVPLGASPFAPGGAALYYQFPEHVALDSLGVDASGNVCVATLIKGGITAISAAGEVEFVPVPTFDPAVTNICFDAGGGAHAYVTSSGLGVLYRTDWPGGGSPLAY